MAFSIVKYIHILSAITAVGLNISYTIWILRAQREPANTAFALKGIKFLDDRIANPAYGVLLLTGLLMIFIGNLSITTLWIILTLVLFAILGVLAVAVYTPLLRDLIKLVDAGDTSSPEFSRLSGRNRIMGPAFGVIVVLILVMMVFKPTL